MGIDLNKVRNRLKSLQSTQKKVSSIWKPSEEKTIIRIVPYRHNPDLPFIELYFHYNLGKRNYLSPISFGRPDPIVEFAEKLKSSGDRESWEIAKKLEPKLRTYAPVIVRGKEHEGVKFWGFGKTVYQHLLSIIDDPDYGDITDPVSGRDITVSHRKEEGKTYPVTDVVIKPNTSVVTEDKDVLEKIKNQKSITDVYPEKSYDELQEVLRKYLEGDDEDEDNSSSSNSQQTQTPSNQNNDDNSNEPESNKVDDIANAFDDLFSAK